MWFKITFGFQKSFNFHKKYPKKVECPEYVLNKNNVEKEKSNFRNIASNYDLDKYNNLYIKYYKNNKKDKLNYELFIVLFIQNIYIYIKIYIKIRTS